MQKAMERASLFESHCGMFGTLVAHLKSVDAFVSLKPAPMQRGEMQAIAEDATSGSTTVLYGRVAAFVRALCGARNPTLAAWQWKHVTFVVTAVRGTEKDEARFTCQRILRLDVVTVMLHPV